MTDRRILLTGGTGQLGGALLPQLKLRGTVFAPSRGELDLSKPDSIASVVQSFKPSLIINSGAYTAVDKAESEPQLAAKINGIAAGVLAIESASLGASMIQLSTDYVFDGESPVPYTEGMTTAPLNVYGHTKLDGEKRALAANPKTTVVRVSWLYDVTGKNFLLTMLRLAETHRKLRVVDDQIGAPTYVVPLAAAITQLVDAQLSAQPVFGVYHLPAGGETSWCGFAREIFANKKALGGGVVPTVDAIGSAEYPTPAARPKNSRLDGGLAAQKLGLKLPTWQAQLQSAMAQLP